MNISENAISRTSPGLAVAEIDLGQTVRGLAPGQRIFLRYTLKRILGRGGMGVVWLAHDEKLDREVALKFVPEMLFLDAAARDDLKRETRRSLELTHPNIVRIYDFMEDESTAAISMEYVDGPTLSQLRVSRNAKFFEPAEIEPWLGGLCAALDYAHGTARMVHRDLKPSNLMVNGRGAVKITDFGIACSLVGSVARVSLYTSSGGTLVYMSPQQLQGEMPSHLDDIYALGATLYELVTGKPPFHSGDIALQVREMDPEPMAARRQKLGATAGAIPPAWEETIAACLAKNPQERPQSAAEVFHRLTSQTRTFPVYYEQTAATMRFSPDARAGSGATLKSAAAPGRLEVAGIPAWKAAIAALAVVGIGAVSFLAFRNGGKTSQPPSATPATVAAAPATMAAAPATSAAAPVVAQAPGGLMIKTTPAGAMVQLGGQAVETSPAVFKGIAPGRYPVRVILPDYETAQLDAEIKPNEFTDLGTVTLVRSTGSVQIMTSPAGSAFELKPAGAADDAGLRTGTTPETVRNLPTGGYTLALKHDGWPDQVETIQVKRGETLPVSWDFPQGQLAVTSTPPGAKVFLGDRLLGVTPLDIAMAPGDYKNVQVTMDGMAPVTREAVVSQGATATVAAGQLQEIVTALQLTSEPPGLAYTLSGTAGDIASGQTPAALFNLPAGEYAVTYKRPGWPDFTAPVSLQPKAPLTIDHDFPEGSVAITSEPAGAQIFQDGNLLGIAPVSVTLPPGTTELTAKLAGMPDRTHSVTVVDGEETNLAFNMESGGSTTSAHHHRHVKKPPASPLEKLGDSIKSFFSGGGTSASSTPKGRKD